MGNFIFGVDLSGATITSTIPANTVVSENKVICASGNNVIGERLSSGRTEGYMLVYEDGGATEEVFYSSNGSSTTTNLSSFSVPETFGILDTVDASAVLYPYLSRVGNRKLFGITEDANREEIPRVFQGSGLPTSALGSVGDLYFM